MAKVWSNRFEETLDPFIERFNSSIDFDKKLILEDINCSIAHARMLGSQNIISNSDSEEIINGLKQIKEKFLLGNLEPKYPSEDIHYFIEQY